MDSLFCDDSYLQLPHDVKVSFWFRLGAFQHETILLCNGSDYCLGDFEEFAIPRKTAAVCLMVAYKMRYVKPSVDRLGAWVVRAHPNIMSQPSDIIRIINQSRIFIKGTEGVTDMK